MAGYPVNWPLGMGETFVGVYDRIRSSSTQFERVGMAATARRCRSPGIDDRASAVN